MYILYTDKQMSCDSKTQQQTVVYILYRFFLIWLLPLVLNIRAENKIHIIDDEDFRKVLVQNIEKLEKDEKFADINLLYNHLERKSFELKLKPVASKKVKKAKDIYNLAVKSTLIIARGYKSPVTKMWQTSMAGGVVIDKSGIVVTNYHVMQPSRGNVMAAMTSDKQVYPVVEVLAADQAMDIAIIKVDAKELTPLPLSTGNDVGSRVYTVSHPDGRLYSLSQGIITRHFYDYDRNMKAHRFAISADFAKGSSGAPILDDKGNVIGLVSSTRSIYYNRENGVDQNLQMVVKNCVPVQSILKLLKSPTK